MPAKSSNLINAQTVPPVPFQVETSNTTLIAIASVDSKEISLNGVEVGKVIEVKGTIGDFRGCKQIELQRLGVAPLFQRM